MKNKIILASLLILLVIVAISISFYFLKEKEAEEKYYDWNVNFIVCKECSPYSPETISLTELEELKDIFVSKFEKDEIIFDKFGTNRFYVNITDNANNKLNDILKDINSDDSINLTIQTVYFSRIIHQEEQKNPADEDEIYTCRYDRECVKVTNGCCGCSSGGGAIAINKDYLNYWGKKLAENCQERICLAVISNHWTCSASPKCINNKCELEQ